MEANDLSPGIDFERLLILAWSLLLLLATTSVSTARTLTWTGNGTFFNRWSDPGNWNPSGPPANGDTLVFPAGFTPSNDLNNLQIHSIQFTGNGSTYLSGNPVTVESDITAASNNGEARIDFDITFSGGGGTFYALGSSFLNLEDNVFLGNNLALNLYASGADIWVQGSIQGAADLVKLGSADAYLKGALVNTYTGGTYVRGGTLHLAKSANVVAISPMLSVGENTTVGGRVTDDNPGQYPPFLDVTVGPYGLWVLNGQAAVTNLSLINATGIGGGNIGGGGILTLDCDVNVSGPIASSISCTLYLGDQTRAFNVDGGQLIVSAVVGTGTAGITKNGSGQLSLTSPNDYPGPTLVHGGVLAVGNAFALGASLGVNAGTTIDPNTVIQFDSVTTSEPLTINQGYIYFSGSNALNGTVTLEADCGLTAEYPDILNTVLQFNNVISGPGALRVDAGTVRLAGPSANTFTGGVRVGSGAYFDQDFKATLDLAKPNNVLAVPGLLDVESRPLNSINPAVVRSFQDNGVEDVRLGHAAQWLLNGHVAAPHSLTFYNDGAVDTQGGQLQMTAAPGTSQIYVAASLDNPSYTAQILGTLSMLAATDEFYVEFGPTLQIGALITGPGNLSKTGPGTLTLAGTAFNDYTGDTFVNQGTLQLNKPFASTAIPGAVEVGAVDGSSAGVLRNLNSYQIVGSIYVHSQGLYDVNSQVENTDFLTLDGNATVQSGGGYLSLKTGAGITVNPGINTTATIKDNLVLDPGNHVITVGSGDTLPGVRELSITAAIGQTSTDASIQKEGPGQMQLSGNSTYTGTTYVNHGKVFPTGSGALGATNGPTIVTNDASLVLDGGILISGEPIYLGSTAPGALESRGGSNTWSGPITLAGDSRIAVTNALNAYGIINGNGNLIKVGPGILTLDGGDYSANVYSGDTFVNEGTLATQKAQLGTVSVPQNVFVGTGPGGPPATLLNRNGSPIGGRVTVNEGGIWDLNSWFVAFGPNGLVSGTALTMNGSAIVTNGSLLFLNGKDIAANAGDNTTASLAVGLYNGSPLTNRITVSAGAHQTKPELVATGPMADVFYPFGMIKDGKGVLRLTATNTYSGSTVVSDGTLLIDGVQPGSPVFVNGGTLGGYGTAGNITLGSAIVSPGESPGMLTCSNFIASSGTFRVELNGNTPGSSYDQLYARGTVSLNGIFLNASLGYASSAGDQFTIINNDGSDAVTGTFIGLPQGKKLYIGHELFQISYTGGSGNDVVLSRLVTPTPPTLTVESVPPASVRLLWATNDPPFSLQSSANLPAPNWVAVLPLPTVIGNTNIVINSTTNTQKFYRLANP